jgi:hypothetical protein
VKQEDYILMNEVMTSREEIQQALRDCKSLSPRFSLEGKPCTNDGFNKTDQGAKNGFEAAQTWQSELGQQFLKEYGRD